MHSYCVVWLNPTNKFMLFMKGERESFYWEAGFDADVILFDKRSAKVFCKDRVNVPHKVIRKPK